MKTLFLASVKCKNSPTTRVIFADSPHELVNAINAIYHDEYPNSILVYRSSDNYTRYYTLHSFIRRYEC